MSRENGRTSEIFGETEPSLPERRLASRTHVAGPTTFERASFKEQINQGDEGRMG